MMLAVAAPCRQVRNPPPRTVRVEEEKKVVNQVGSRQIKRRRRYPSGRVQLKQLRRGADGAASASGGSSCAAGTANGGAAYGGTAYGGTAYGGTAYGGTAYGDAA